MCRKLIYLISLVLVLSLTLINTANAELVGWWKFDEGSGTTAYDFSGNGNDGTLEDAGAMGWEVGMNGMALRFEGGGYVSVGPDPWSSITTQFTVAFWILGSDSQPLNGWCFGAWGGDARLASCHVPWSDGTVYFDSGGDWATERISKPAAGDEYKGQWRHWTFVKDADTGEKRIYLDGVLWHSGTGFTHTAEGVTEFYIGAGRASERYPYTGLIDDFRLYDHALSEAEILGAMTGEPWPYAWGPNPKDGAMLEQTWGTLLWSPGDFAVSHDVYLGDNFDDVNAGVEGTFMGNQDATSLLVGFFGFPYPDGLVPGTTYYWRIDEVDDTDPNSPWKGDVWSFWIQPRTVHDHVPQDNSNLFWDATNERLGIGTASPSYKLEVEGLTAASAIRSHMGFDIYPVPDPTTRPTGEVSAGGSVDTGLHWYAVSYTTALGETHATYTAAQIETTDGNNTVTLTIPTSTDPRVTGRKLYRTKAGGGRYQEYLLATIGNNTDTTYEDTVADSTLTIGPHAVYYRVNTTSRDITVGGDEFVNLDENAVIIGSDAAQTLTTGGRDVFIGPGAGSGATTEHGSVAIGYCAGDAGLASAGLNVLVGEFSGSELTIGGGNTAVGGFSLLNNVTSGGNSVYGYSSGRLTTGQSNTFLGSYSGYANTSGSNGIHLGYFAGYYETAGDKLIIDSFNRGDEATQRSSAIIYGVMSATATDQILSLGGGGKVGIGTTTPSAKVDINSDILRLRTAKTPASAGDTGNQGDICWDANYLYICVAPNTWKRAAIATW